MTNEELLAHRDEVYKMAESNLMLEESLDQVRELCNSKIEDSVELLSEIDDQECFDAGKYSGRVEAFKEILETLR